MRQLWSAFAIVALGLQLLAGPVAAQPAGPRIAFVAGNAGYPKSPLRNTLNDAGLVTDALRSIGFEVYEAADLGRADFLRTYGEFIARLQAASGASGIGFVYVNGYGLAAEGDNYILPVDARIEREADIASQAIRLSTLIAPLAALPLQARMLIVDGSRPMPFRLPGRPLAPGLEAVEAPAGTIVALASGPGTVAEDSQNAYGVYALAIAEMIRERGRDLDSVFIRIRARTHLATQGRQTPWHASAMREAVALVPEDTATGSSGGEPNAEAASRGARAMREIGPEDGYAVAIERDTLAAYAEFAEAFPRHPYRSRLLALSRSRREALVWQRATKLNTAEAYWTYLRRYPRGLYNPDAERLLKRLSAAVTPPAGFKPVAYDDIPDPHPDEPEDYIAGYDEAPPPTASLIGPQQALFRNLPAPRAARGTLTPVALPAVPPFTAPPRIQPAVPAADGPPARR